MSAGDRIEHARLLYQRAVFGGDASALATADRELDGVEADLALARGRIIHTRFLQQRDEDPERLAEDPHELALFAPVLAANGGGALVNLGSITAFANFPEIGSFCATKAALWSLTKWHPRRIAPAAHARDRCLLQFHRHA